MQNLRLSDLKIGERAIIKSFENEELPSRLYEIGILPGIEISIQFTGPFHDPICLAFNQATSKIALRKSEAKQINVEKV